MNTTLVTISGVKYVVEDEITTKQMRAEGLTHVADMLEKTNTEAMLVVRRPDGRKSYATYRKTNGNYIRPFGIYPN